MEDDEYELKNWFVERGHGRWINRKELDMEVDLLKLLKLLLTQSGIEN